MPSDPLARLLVQEGDPAAGRALLTDRFGWFTEGLDTDQLVEASELLATIADLERRST